MWTCEPFRIPFPTASSNFILIASFIERFPEIPEPLTKLQRKGESFAWRQKEVRAFHLLKRKLTPPPPEFAHFPDRAPTAVHTDPSGHGIGAVLVQRTKAKITLQLLPAARLLSRETYSFTEECPVFVRAAAKLNPRVSGCPFHVVTENHTLCWLFGLKDFPVVSVTDFAAASVRSILSIQIRQEACQCRLPCTVSRRRCRSFWLCRDKT